MELATLKIWNPIPSSACVKTLSSEAKAEDESTKTLSVSTLSCWSLNPLSLWIKLLIICYSCCRQQQVILAEILLHTDEQSKKHPLSNKFKSLILPPCPTTTPSIVSLTHTFIVPQWVILALDITLTACNCNVSAPVDAMLFILSI